MARHRDSRGRMPKHWDKLSFLTPQDFTASSTSSTAGLGLDEAWTVIRLMGEYTIIPTAAPVAGDAMNFGVGIAVVSADAFAVAAGAALPDPAVDLNYPWLYNAVHAFHFGTTSVDPQSAGGSLRHSFDVKSMRKIKPQETLCIIFQYVDAVGTPPMTVMQGAVRVLIAQ